MTLTPPAQTGWKARLDLTFAPGKGKTILAENRHSGPLVVQRPFYPEQGVCHVYLLHPPGGVVGGDRLNLRVGVEPGAHGLVTTPGATKFYRTAAHSALQKNDLRVAGGVVEWMPQETIVFPGAEAELATTIQLDGTAAFLGWEIISLGLPSRHQRFATGSLTSRFDLRRDGRPLLKDRLEIDGAARLDSMIGLRGFPVTGLFVATGCDESVLEPLRQLVPRRRHHLVGVTVLGEVLVVRYLGDSTFEAREIFQGVWGWLRPHLLGIAACPPRIWST